MRAASSTINCRTELVEGCGYNRKPELEEPGSLEDARIQSHL